MQKRYIYLAYIDLPSVSGDITVENIHSIGGSVSNIPDENLVVPPIANNCVRLWGIKLPSDHKYTQVLLGKDYGRLQRDSEEGS